MSRTWTVACLAGDGVGPELMGEACRVLAVTARLHALRLDDVHLPFGGEAVTRGGHPLPLSTRAAYRDADAVFVCSPDEPALDRVKTDLDLVWSVSRVHNESRGDLVVVEPVGDGTDERAITRAFELAAVRRARLTSVGSTPEWTEAVVAEAECWDGLDVEHVTLGGVLTRFRDHPGTVDLIVAPGHLASAIVDAAAHLAGSLPTVASAWLPEEGPGLFAPHGTDAAEVAGLGVADCAGTLLAASLLLAEGLGQRSAGRTLERAVAAVLTMNETMNETQSRKTRNFADAVIERLPEARTDHELFQEVHP
jgi:3-isopropylmalate dehydrogenase